MKTPTRAENGRKTLFNDVFKWRESQQVQQRKIEGKDDLSNLLKEVFNIDAKALVDISSLKYFQ